MAKHTDGLTLNDFAAFLPEHNYIFKLTDKFWPAAGVNAALRPVPVVDKNGNSVLDKKTGEPKTVPATVWLDRHQPVHHLCWAPGDSQLIPDRLLIEGGWRKRKHVTSYNFYHPPSLVHGDARKAGPWLELVQKLYPDDWRRFINFCAHLVQRPHIKINHAIVLGGVPGIGKDTILEPVTRAVGIHNVREVSPAQVMERFNGFMKAVLLRVSEVRDLGDSNRFAFHAHMLTILATPPTAIRVNEKNIPEQQVLNVAGVVYTTNHLSDGIYLPPDDRRHDVMWSELQAIDFPEGYWFKHYQWLDKGGDGHVAAYLAKHNISKFDPKAPPPKTDAFWAIADAGHAPEEGVVYRDAAGKQLPTAIEVLAAMTREGKVMRESEKQA